MRRVLIGGMLHETNTFNPIITGLEAFKLRGLFCGDELLAARRGTQSEIGGFIAGLEDAGLGVVPAVFSEAMPAGLVSSEALQAILDGLLDALRGQPVDGILLALHGAMVTQEHDDGEGYLLRRLRAAVGRALPIIVTLDLHATLTPAMAASADALVIYRTYPHMDKAERGREAAALLARALRGEEHPVVAVAKRPLLIGPPQNVLPGDWPMRAIMARAREMELLPRVLAACPAHGFMQQDVPLAGVGAAVTTDGDAELAARLADELAEMLFAHRRDYPLPLPDAAEAIRLAQRCERPPVAIADTGDNVGGGTPGDGTALLHEILRQGVESAFVQLWDPEAAQQAARAGVGARITLAVGGKSDPLYGPPAEISGVVRALSDGVYLNRAWGGYGAGTWENMGLTARLDAGGLTVVVTSLSASPNNILHAQSIGVYPEDYRMTVCKGGLAFREAYKPPVTNTYIQADTPGYSSSDLSRFAFRKLRRPIAPLDEI
jgi:microcystin degradation protein MlrC